MSSNDFSFEGITITRVIIHRIHVRNPDKSLRDPETRDQLLLLDIKAKDALQKRITAALNSNSHGIEMTIEDSSKKSFFTTTASMMGSSDTDFVEHSKELAHSLNKAQQSTSARDGILALIEGTVGEKSSPFIAAIKAEIQDGFVAEKNDDGDISMKYLEDLLLTAAQKLYKIGVLIKVIASPKTSIDEYNIDHYRTFLYDHLMTETETRKAAAYFYSVFLGMSIQKSIKKTTQDFFEYTKSFIDGSELSTDDKIDLHEALRTELRSNKASINMVEFSKTNMSEELRPLYQKHMTSKNFTAATFDKDTAYIKAKLKNRRKFTFTNGVWITLPSDKDAAKDLIEIQPANDGVTTVKIKGYIQGHE